MANMEIPTFCVGTCCPPQTEEVRAEARRLYDAAKPAIDAYNKHHTNKRCVRARRLFSAYFAFIRLHGMRVC